MTPTDQTVEAVARAICRSQLVQAGQWGPRGIEKQTEKYWQDWKPEAFAALSALPSTRDKALVKSMRAALGASQAVLAAWIVPDSEVSDAEALSQLLGILDDGALVEMLRGQALASEPSN